MIRPVLLAILPVLLVAPAAQPQTKSMSQGAHRMELMLERFDGSTWKAIDPALVLAHGDRVRFRSRGAARDDHAGDGIAALERGRRPSLNGCTADQQFHIIHLIFLATPQVDEAAILAPSASRLVPCGSIPYSS